jgi:hypothetical protein
MLLEQLREHYPLAQRWGEPTVFVETTCVSGVRIHVAGLSARCDAGETAIGSAGDLLESPLRRAYFELLERASTVTMFETKGTYLATRSASGVGRERVGMGAIVPTTRDPDRWRYARSNGVAAGSSWHEACARAEWELVERDRILRSWYGELPPIRVELPRATVPSALNTVYSFEAYLFGDSASSNVEVAGVFGFPRRPDAPLLYGFGARPSVQRAVAVAAGECVQRLGFLWGEAIPSQAPIPSPTPDFHQDFFLWPSAHDRLHRWLGGEHLECDLEFVGSEPARKAERRFVDMTPPELTSRLFVAKAVPDGEIPLVFGDGHPDLAGQSPDALRIHPIC